MQFKDKTENNGKFWKNQKNLKNLLLILAGACSKSTCEFYLFLDFYRLFRFSNGSLCLVIVRKPPNFDEFFIVIFN